MDMQRRNICVWLYHVLFFISCFLMNQSSARENLMAAAPAGNPTAVLNVNASSRRKIPDDFLGIFFEEINHAGSGGLWSELVSNRGFEGGFHKAPGPIDPWVIIGNESSIGVATDQSSCFTRNKVALRMDVHCDHHAGSNVCPHGGVGVYNPGFWGMNIEKGKTYKLIFYFKAKNMTTKTLDIKASLTSPDGMQTLATANIIKPVWKATKWAKTELTLKATASNTTATLQLTVSRKGVYWLDQVSLMPTDTHKGHGFRKDLYSMIENLSPKFMRFPGGTYVQGVAEINGVRWKESVGPWENRPGHYNDAWNYWTDDGLGYYELLILAEDLGVTPIWVFNIGMGRDDFPLIKPEDVQNYVKDALDGIEFALGRSDSTWGSVRAKMGHPKPFSMKYISVGNENCNKDPQNRRQHYEDVVYPKFYSALRKAYPHLKLINNCNPFEAPLKNEADLFDYHTYPSYDGMFNQNTLFDNFNRTGSPKAFVSEFAVWKMPDCGIGCLHAALSEAAFLIGLERNSDIVELVCYAPLFANVNNKGWIPDAIWFNSWQHFGGPSYWVQHMFKESSGATLLSSTLETNSSMKVVASAIISHNATAKVNNLKIKVVNYGDETVNLKISISNFNKSISASKSKMTVLTSGNLADQNSFEEPNKVAPQSKMLTNAGSMMDVVLSPHTLAAYDLLLK